jgi:hypothetical protein
MLVSKISCYFIHGNSKNFAYVKRSMQSDLGRCISFLPMYNFLLQSVMRVEALGVVLGGNAGLQGPQRRRSGGLVLVGGAR